MSTFASVYFLIDNEVYCADKLEKGLLESFAKLDDRAGVYFAPKRIDLASKQLKADVDAILNERSANVRENKTENFTPKEFVRYDNSKEDDERETAPLACLLIDYAELADPARRQDLRAELESVKDEFAGIILIAAAAPDCRVSFNNRELLKEIGDEFDSVKNEAWIRVFFASFERYCDGSIVLEDELVDWLTTMLAQDLVVGESDNEQAAIYRDPEPDRFTIDVLGGRVFHIDVDSIRKTLVSHYWDGMLKRIDDRRAKRPIRKGVDPAETFLDDLCKDVVLVENGSSTTADLVRKSDEQQCVFRPLEYHDPISVGLDVKGTKRSYEYFCSRVNGEIAEVAEKLERKLQEVLPNVAAPLKDRFADSVVAGRDLSGVANDYVKETEELLSWKCRAEKLSEKNDVDRMLDDIDRVWSGPAILWYLICSFAFVGTLASCYFQMIHWRGWPWIVGIAVCGVSTALAFAMGVLAQKGALRRAQEAVDVAFKDRFDRFSFEIAKKVEELSAAYVDKLKLSVVGKGGSRGFHLSDAQDAETALKDVFAPVELFEPEDSPTNLFSFSRFPDLERSLIERNDLYSEERIDRLFNKLCKLLDEFFKYPNPTNLGYVKDFRCEIYSNCISEIDKALSQVDFEFFLRDDFDQETDSSAGIERLLERIVLSRACVFARGPLVAELANTLDESSMRDFNRKKFYIAPRMTPETRSIFQNLKPNDVSYRESGLEGGVLSAAVLRVYQDNPGL